MESTVVKKFEKAVELKVKSENNSSGEADESAPLYAKRKAYRKHGLKEALNLDKNEEGFEDSRRAEEEFKICLRLDFITGLFSMIGLFWSIQSYDIEFEGNDNANARWHLMALLISTGAAIAFNFLMHLRRLKFYIRRNVYKPDDTLISTGRYKKFLVELVIFLIQPYPFLVGIKVQEFNRFYGVEFFYHLNDYLYILMIARLYIIVRVILNYTRYRSPRGQRLSAMYGTDNTYTYSIKCLMRDYPTSVTLSILIASIMFFGYMMRIAERPLNRFPETVVSMDYNYYFNAVWCVVLTMTTVGYGDFYPRTDLGRFIIFLVCIWGVFVVSLVVVALNNLLSMNKAEEDTLTCMHRLEMRDRAKEEAAQVIKNMVKYAANNNKKDRTKTSNHIIINDLKNHLRKWTLLNREIRNIRLDNNVSEELSLHFGLVQEELKESQGKHDTQMQEIRKRQEAMEAAMNRLCEKFGVPGVEKVQ